MAYLRRVQTISRLASQIKTLKTAPPIFFSEEVLAAKSENKPIVALESTIITHGMPRPQNLETAMEVENIIRDHGAVPATIAILKGQLTVGLTQDQLQYLAETKGVVKTSRRDLAPVVASKLDGATTVAGTIIAADLVDIPVFVTGGLGGVHREGETTLDISADLNELGRSRTLVVCSGVKSILDIGRTLEYLETQGVCVCAYGDTNDFPAFYCTKSGHQAPYHVSSAGEAARLLQAVYQLDLASGTVVAVPVPKEYAMDETVIDSAIKQSLKEAKEMGVKGKEVTPFILSAVAQVTEGASLRTNIALIKNNAKIGARIAVEFNKLTKAENLKKVGFSTSENFKGTLSRSLHTSNYVCNKSFGENGQRILLRKMGSLSFYKESLCVNKNGSYLDIFKRGFHRNSVMCDSSDKKVLENKGDVLVIGGANVDRTYRVSEDNIYVSPTNN